MKTPAERKAIFSALSAFALFSVHDVFIKTLGETYSTFQIIFFSVLFGFPLVTLVLLRDRTSGTLIPRHPLLSLLRTGLAVFSAAAAFYAFAVLPLAQTYSILFAVPLVITILAVPVLGESLGWRRLSAVVIGLIGVVIVVRPGGADLGLGHVAALVAALGSAGASLIVRKIGRDERSIVLILYPMMANFLIMLAILPFVYEPMPLRDILYLLALSVFAVTAMLLLINAYSQASAVLVAPMQYSQIIWATLFGYFLFEETLDSFTIIGAAIIIGSGIYIVLREDSVSENAPVLRTRSRAATPALPRLSMLLPQRLWHRPPDED